MDCPFCGHSDSQVKDSRTAEDGMAIRRRRQCMRCEERFTTFERVQLRDITVVKRNGRRTQFDREKLQKSIQLALNKRRISQDQIDEVIGRIVRDLEAKSEAEISSQEIGALIMAELKKLDPVAFIRFASVYMDFSSSEDFNKFIRKVEGR